MSLKRSLFLLTCFLIFFQDLIAIPQAEELLIKYDFTNGSKLPTTKHAAVFAGNEFGVYNTSAINLEMILQNGTDYLSVQNLHTAVATNRYGYLSLAASEGYTVTISRIEVLSKKGNSNTLNARCYLYDSLKNSPRIISNMIYSGTNAGYPIPENWELKSFVPSAGVQTLNDTVFFSFTSTQAVAGTVASDWQIDELLFYGVVAGGEEIINDVTVSLDVTKPGHVISKYMNGSHFVYGNEADNIYKDERIADWMRSAKTGIIRWPGGTAVMSYHWDNLTGNNFGHDRWDVANYVEENISAENYMDLDEYIAYCRKVNAEPMVGINIRSGKFYKTDADGLDEARRLIQYCVDKGYKVKHWYIGNEGYAKGFGASLYAQYIDLYAAELKKVDPDITIVGDWKFGPEDKDRYNDMLTIVQNSTQLDVMEIHEKWGNDWGIVSGTTLADWKTEFPIYNGKIDYYSKKFHADVKNLGKNTKLGFNEWGIGGMVDGNNYHYALLAADLMTQMFKNEVYSACYWNLNISSGDGSKSRIFTIKSSTKDFDKFNPISKVFQQYAPTLGENYLEINSSDPKVYGIASINATKDTLQVLLLNKSAQKSRIAFSLNGFTASNTLSTDWFDELGLSAVEEIKAENTTYTLPAYSFSRLQFTGKISTKVKNAGAVGENLIIKRNGDQLQVILSADETIHQLKIFDLKGILIKSLNFLGNTCSVDLAGMNSGLYFLQVKGNERTYIGKIIL
jgi:alpha-L-arabinofuranosidase